MEQWSEFVAHSLETRLEPERFGKFAILLNNKHPQPASRIADLLLRPSKNGSDSLDSQVPRYVHALLQLGQIDVAAVLHALLRYSNLRPAQKAAGTGDAGREELRWQRSYIHEEATAYMLTKVVSTGLQPRNERTAGTFVATLTEWAKLLSVPGQTEGILQDQTDNVDAQNSEAISLRIAFGTLLVASSENVTVMAALSRPGAKDVLKAYSQALITLIPFIHNASPMLGERLDAFRTQSLVPLLPIDKKTQAANDELDEILDSTMTLGANSIPVADLPIMNSRAGLYVYLQALLVGKPITDDNVILNYLHNRYQGDIQTACNDLILSSFDVLANAIVRNEPAQTTLPLRSFLINKVPLLLTILSQSLFPPVTAEFCITEALHHVDTNTFPTFSSMFDESSNGIMMADSVRQDFCFACCLHGLIPESSIESLLGEVPMQTLPEGGRSVKEDLVQQCLADPDTIEGLVDGLERMDGNVGATSQALAEIIAQFCQTKETTSLKALCGHLARKPSSLDIMLLFEKPATILRPICELLDGWRYDEDQGEYQPVYEEFGCILLLIMVFVHRYNLTIVDLGIPASDSFIAKFLVKGTLCRPMEELSELEKNQLDGWIKGLFNAEGGALGDEIMAGCPPQDFYLLVPTLFRQIVLACSTGQLHDETLRGGLEFLVGTFLLPSLVGALVWLSHHLWECRGDSNVVIQILQILIKPGSISNEASQMLASIFNIVAKPLEHSLFYLQRLEPSRQDVEPLLKALRPHLSFSRTAASDRAELNSWAGREVSGMADAVRFTMQLLIRWSLTPGMRMSYTHRQILSAIRVIGAKRLLHAIIEEVKLQTAADSGPVAIDVAAAIICAPDAQSATTTSLLSPNQPAPLQRRLHLRDALKIEAEAAPKIHKTDVLHAETVIRLYRRVEAQLALPMPQLDLQAQSTTGIMHAHLGLGDAQAGATLDATGHANTGDHGALGGAQSIDEAIAAAAAASNHDMMDLGLDHGGMMGVGGDDLLGDMKLDF